MAHNTNDTSVSLNKFISSTGFCSRREADRYIEEGRVTINGKVSKLGNRVKDGDTVKVDGEPLKTNKRTLYIAFNKPKGIVCTTDQSEPNNIISFINHKARLFPIGRLDKLSQGLIFLTNDGDIVNKILRADNNHEKEYEVTVDKPITPEFVKQMSNGVKILGTYTKKCTVSQNNKNTFKITLIQGLNRQIRRMCETLNYKVTKLVRTRIMNVKVGNLQEGTWRPLTPTEMEQINKMIATSSKTQKATKAKSKSSTPTDKKKFFYTKGKGKTGTFSKNKTKDPSRKNNKGKRGKRK